MFLQYIFLCRSQSTEQHFDLECNRRKGCFSRNVQPNSFRPRLHSMTVLLYIQKMAELSQNAAVLQDLKCDFSNLG